MTSRAIVPAPGFRRRAPSTPAAGPSKRGLGSVLIVLALLAPSASADDLAARDRRPSALAIIDGGSTLLVANRRSGTISEVDAKAEKVVAEHAIGRGLIDLAPLPDGHHLLALDPEAEELLLLDRIGRSVSVVARVSVGRDVMRVAVLPDGKTFAVTSRWPRRLTIVAIEAGEMKVARTLALAFSPREVLPLGDGSALIVADAFGGKLAVVEAKGPSVVSIRELPAHNLRGLGLSADSRSVLMAHQATSRLATSGFDDIHWGALIKNQMRSIPLSALLDPSADLAKASTLKDLDDVGHAAGDPEALAIDPRGRPVIALAGVGEVSFLAYGGAPAFRIPVGSRPVAVAIAPSGHSAYVADAGDDSVSVVPLGGGSPRTISLGPRPEPSAVDRGERLFSSAKLSHHGWLSCRSCHPDGHTTGRLADTLGDGSYGAPKLVPSLLNSGSTGPWGWLGNFDRLEGQVRSSVETTMRGPAPTDDQVADLTAYLRSLSPPPSLGDGATDRGREVFRAQNCAACHAGSEFTSAKPVDVGLADDVGHRAFNPPSLRGVGHRDRFLHDGRASSLPSLFCDHGHPPGASVSDEEVADLVAYLKTL